MRTHARPVLGLVYLIVLALLVALCIQTYRKAMPWQDALDITIETRAPGLELNPQSDVKFQGAIVGYVRNVTSDGTGAQINVAIEPDQAHLVPAEVDAAILPKTLFGEKYVDLRAPADAADARIEDGAVITQSTTSVELGVLFDRLVPILRTLDPAKLSILLTNLADAVEGRGDEIARTLRNTQELIQRLDPSLDTLVYDLRRLGEVSEVYADGTPDLIDLLDNSSAISRDLVEVEGRLATFLDELTGLSHATTDILARNGESLIRLNGRSRPVLQVLDNYAIVLPCVLDALRVGNNLANQATAARGSFIGLSIDMMLQNDAYHNPEDLPFGDNDSNLNRLPAQVPSWKPHCPVLPERVLNVKSPKPYSLQPYSQVDPPSPSRTRPSAVPSSTDPREALGYAREAMATAVAAEAMSLPVADVPAYASLLTMPLIAEGEVPVR